jgi:hypothetical protein
MVWIFVSINKGQSFIELGNAHTHKNECDMNLQNILARINKFLNLLWYFGLREYLSQLSTGVSKRNQVIVFIFRIINMSG